MDPTPIEVLVVKEDENEIEETKKEEMTFLNIVIMIIVLYAIICALCYFFNERWFETICMNPFKKVKSMFTKSTDKQ